MMSTSSLKRSHSGSMSKKVANAKASSSSKLKKKIVTYKYIDESSSSNDTSSEESASTSDGYSSYSDCEPSSPKRSKESGCHKGERSKRSNKEKSSKNSEVECSEEEFVVEKIVDMMCDKSGRRLFRIKWQNYPSAENTWEPIENLTKCQDIVEEFLESRVNNNNNSCKKKAKSVSSTKCMQEGRNYTKESHSGHIRKNGMSFSSTSKIRNSMMSSVQKVVNADGEVWDKPVMKEVNQMEKVAKCVEGVNTTAEETYIAIPIPKAGDLFYIRILNDGQMNWIYIDLAEPVTAADIYYRCVVTEDLTGKEPKLIYGATTAVNGEIFCLVQFEGYSYVEIIPPDNFFHKFPTFRRYFELQCPHLFPKNSH